MIMLHFLHQLFIEEYKLIIVSFLTYTVYVLYSNYKKEPQGSVHATIFISVWLF